MDIRCSLALVTCLGCGQTAFSYLAPPAGDDSRASLGMVHASVSAALRAEYRGQIDHGPPPPVALVPTDGSELELRALAASVEIDGPLAHTELRFTFRNREARQREGRFSIALPADAAVGRFAMKIGNQWREARVVTRDQGRQVYETFLHRKVDPALLEQDLGNQFSARVFPIAPSADKEIVIAYDHQVSAARPYVLALAGLPAVPALSVAITHDGAVRAFDRHGKPPEDVVIGIDGGASAVSAGGSFVARIDGAGGTAAQAPLERVLILVDTSASRAPVMGRQVELVRKLAAALPPTSTVAIAAFDHAVTELYRGRADRAAAAADALYEHGALGASDLGEALARAAAERWARVVIVGDGAPTLGEREAKQLAAIAAVLGRVDAVQIGQSIDRETLTAIVGAGRQPGAILDGADAVRVAAQLAAALPMDEAIRVDGAVASFPPTTHGVPPGEPIWVSGQRPAAGPLVVRVGSRVVEIAAPRAAEPARVRRAVAKAELVELTARLQVATTPADIAALGSQIEGVAMANNLVSARTSLLVLESDDDERRMLGSATPPAAPAPATAPAAATTPLGAAAGSQADTTGAIEVTGAAPTIDPASTRTGITIDPNYVRSIPVPGRSFETTLSIADRGEAIRISGSSTIENKYFVDGINSRANTNPNRAGSSAMPFGMPSHESVATPSTPPPPPQYTGKLRAVMAAIASGDRRGALDRAVRWQLANPGDVAAVLALGESLEARGSGALAARAYGSILDLYPNRAELARAAGERLDRVASTLPAARRLAIDAYRRALRERPDHVSTYRLLAYALLRDDRGDEALELLRAGLARASRPSVHDLLAADASVIAAAVVARDPGKRSSLGAIATRPSLRFVLSWETDANDVDLHVHDRTGGHAFFGVRKLASGGELSDDLTDGYGPEVFTINAPAAFPYHLGVHYYNRGAMGLGLGTVQVIRHDGAGHVTVEDRPFVIQSDGAMIDLGTVRR